MVSIVIPKNSLSDVINAGLAHRYYTNKESKVKLYTVSEDKKKQFWLNIRKYVDSRDRSLLILDYPLLTEEEMKQVNLRPYEYSVLYIPSKLLAVSPEDRKILLEKGIAVVPPRDIWKCFLGNYDGQVEMKWMEINRIISLEAVSQTNSQHTINVIKGLLKTSEENPNLAIEKVAEDDMNFFEKLGERRVPRFQREVCEPDIELISATGKMSELLQIAFVDLLNHRKIPLGIKSKDLFMFLIDSPTFASHVLADWKLKPTCQFRFGKNVAICTKVLDDVRIGMLLGKLSQVHILLRVGRPELAAQRTLYRRLLGGPGPGGRVYRGIRERFPDLEFRNNMVNTPRRALEEVIDTLKETRTKYEIVT